MELYSGSVCYHTFVSNNWDKAIEDAVRYINDNFGIDRLISVEPAWRQDNTVQMIIIWAIHKRK